MKSTENNAINIHELKQFALTMSWAIPCLFMLILPWLFEHSISWWPLAVSGILVLLYVAYPKGIYPIYRGWMSIASVIGWINTRIILGICFYFIILPMGIFLRIFGKLQYQTKRDPKSNSFWITRNQQIHKDDLERPF